MTFVKYNTKNDAISTLLAWISASATSVQVQSSDGAKFPVGNFIATIIQYTSKTDRTSVIIKKEKVLVSTNATDTFTITRGFWGDTPTAFETGDTIVLNITSEVVEDIQDEVTQVRTDFESADTALDDAKLAKWGLRESLATAWRMFFSNGSKNETELALWTSWTYLKSNGASSAPSWDTPPFDINGQTTITTVDNDNDYAIVADASNSFSPRKVLVKNVNKYMKVAGLWASQISLVWGFINFTSATMQVLSTTPTVGTYNVCITDTNLISNGNIISVNIKKNGTSIFNYLNTDSRVPFGWAGFKGKWVIIPVSCNGTDVITIEQTKSGTGFEYLTDVYIRYDDLVTYR